MVEPQERPDDRDWTNYDPRYEIKSPVYLRIGDVFMHAQAGTSLE